MKPKQYTSPTGGSVPLHGYSNKPVYEDPSNPVILRDGKYSVANGRGGANLEGESIAERTADKSKAQDFVQLKKAERGLEKGKYEDKKDHFGSTLRDDKEMKGDMKRTGKFQEFTFGSSVRRSRSGSGKSDKGPKTFSPARLAELSAPRAKRPSEYKDGGRTAEFKNDLCGGRGGLCR